MSRTWNQQFRSSLEQYIDREESTLYRGDSVDSYLSAKQGLGLYLEDEDGLLEAAMPAIAANVLFYTIVPLVEQAVGICQSPIEKPMLLALYLLGNEAYEAVRIKAGDYFVLGSGGAPDDLIIQPQAQIGDYRVDFLLTSINNWERDHFSERKIVVECDGHDFHERTKDQARRDRSRDRMLQSMGIPVYRFTGSEIWADTFACAAQALDGFRAAPSRPGET